MAILWRHRAGGRTYEVRGAGRTRRLYTDGVFHSQFNPAQPVTGNLWDLFVLAGLCLARGGVRRALMLGVGGGAAIRLMQRHLQPGHIIGVDLDAVHLGVARRFFGVGGRNVELVHDDAVAWLERYRGAPFDLIVDDLFDAGDGTARRSVEMTRAWGAGLARHLAADGVLAVNFASLGELKCSALVQGRALRSRFARTLVLKTPQNENAVGVFSRDGTTPGELRARVRTLPVLARALALGNLRYTARSV